MTNVDLRDQWETQFGRRDPKVICVGLNYRDHATEQGVDPPSAPLLFAKFANTLCSNEDPIELPQGIGHVDAEAELAVIIGQNAHHIRANNAYDVVYGWTCANDVSARDAQFGDGQWFRGKSYDSFCPIGPRIVPRDDLDPSNLAIRQLVNGKAVQQSHTNQLIFPVDELIAYTSSVLTLEPGDLILTGTPAGVGVFRNPKVSLQAGDLVEVEIEGIGTLRNRVTVAQPWPGATGRRLS